MQGPVGRKSGRSFFIVGMRSGDAAIGQRHCLMFLVDPRATVPIGLHTSETVGHVACGGDVILGEGLVLPGQSVRSLPAFARSRCARLYLIITLKLLSVSSGLHILEAQKRNGFHAASTCSWETSRVRSQSPCQLVPEGGRRFG